MRRGFPCESSPATAHMYIIQPLLGGISFGNLFSTHPPTAERIARLNGMHPGSVIELLMRAEVSAGPLCFAQRGAADTIKLMSQAPGSTLQRAAELERALRSIIRGKDDVVRLALVAILARGHLLIEGVPGVGKTTLAHALARAIDCDFRRVQFTSDMLPSDVLGISVYSTAEERFEFKRGPIFTNILLADEINRTTPKTQSALLEAMNERQVTVDGHPHPLPNPFLVIATQNPVEHHGTYPLPESQLDRFLIRARMGYPEAGSEREILRGHAGAASPGGVASGAHRRGCRRAAG